MSVTVPAQNGGVTTAASSSTETGKPDAAPSEVGWLFVPQYYTFLNNDPSKLHCFYSKRSTLVHGTELEDAPLCIGQQQIHDKIVSLGFSDAKVFVSNVDSQASASNGIIIQVLGEMSNKGGAWRKFAQTFFLAEQPNGYFVLNDIFRYLKEEDETEEAGEGGEVAQSEVPEPEAKGVDVVQQQAESAVDNNAAPQTSFGNASVSTAPANALQAAQANGDFKAQEPTDAEPSEVGVDKKVTVVERDEAPAQPKAEVAAAQSAAQTSNPNAATPALNGNAESATNAAPPPEPVAAPAPSGPKTWANLAASNATKWGSTVSAEARGVSSARETAQQGPARGGASQPSAPIASASSGSAVSGSAGRTGHVFIKNVIVENMPAEGLQVALESKYGPMKECQIIASKACAFGEFTSPEMARKAIQASLPVSQGGEGGVKVGKNGWAVIVEEKRKPSERGPAGGGARGGRGGAASGPNASRGGARGGRGGPGASRGGRGAAP